MIPHIHRARVLKLVASLDVKDWRVSPAGTGQKTANVAVEFGLIRSAGPWKKRRHRLTIKGACLAEWTRRHSPA